MHWEASLSAYTGRKMQLSWTGPWKEGWRLYWYVDRVTPWQGSWSNTASWCTWHTVVQFPWVWSLSLIHSSHKYRQSQYWSINAGREECKIARWPLLAEGYPEGSQDKEWHQWGGSLMRMVELVQYGRAHGAACTLCSSNWLTTMLYLDGSDGRTEPCSTAWDAI